MKRKLLSGIFALALLVTAGWGVSKTMQSDADLSDLALSNVEALAQSEGSFGVCIYYCTMTLFYDCTLWYSGGTFDVCYGYRAN